MRDEPGRPTADQVSLIRERLFATEGSSPMAAEWAQRFREAPEDQQSRIAAEFLEAIERLTDDLLAAGGGTAASADSEEHQRLADVRQQLSDVRARLRGEGNR